MSDPRVPERIPTWFGTLLALVGIVGVVLAGIIAPVQDPNPLKMSCFWAMRAAVAMQAMVGACGVAAMLAQSRESIRVVAVMGAAAALLLLVVLHRLIPVMPHNVPLHRTPQDVLALLALALCAAALVSARPEPDLNEALDALEAVDGEPGA